jgi:hypothetical protein
MSRSNIVSVGEIRIRYTILVGKKRETQLWRLRLKWILKNWNVEFVLIMIS